MRKPSHIKFFGKRENGEKRVIKLKGGGKVRLRKLYSLKKRGEFIDLFCGPSREKMHREKIHSFPNGVTAEEIKKYVLEYEAILKKEKEKKMWLKEYCMAPMSRCKGNCDECNTPNYKKWAIERKEEGKKVVRPVKTGGFMKAIKERNDLLKRKPPENKIIFFDRKPKRGGRW